MINANIRTKNFLINLVYFIPVTELVTCYMYKSPLSVSVSNRLNISHMGLYGSVMQVFWRHRRNKDSWIESFIMDVRTIKFLIQDRRGRHRHGEGIVIGLMPVNNVLCHNVTARVMWCHDVYNQMHFWHILMFWCKAQPFTSLATTDSLYTSIKHSLKHSSRSDIHKYFQDYGPFKIFRGSLKIPNYV